MMVAVAPEELFSTKAFHDALETHSISSDEEADQLLAFALPPKSIPMRRSVRNLRTNSRRASTSPVKRSLSQKRKRRSVSFDDENMVQVQTIERIPEEFKADIWYNGVELNDLLSEELKGNFQTWMLRGQNYPLEQSNLTWRGLEEHIPCPANDGYEGYAKRLEKIRNHMLVLLALVRVSKHSELAERSWILSKPDRDDAIEKAQEDAYEALRDHGVEHGRPVCPSYFDDAAYDEEDGSTIKSIVSWLSCL